MTKRPNPMPQDLQSMIFYAFRYCLGRQTYSVGMCVDYLLKHWEELDVKHQEMIKTEIAQAIEKGEAGHRMDVEQWARLL